MRWRWTAAAAWAIACGALLLPQRTDAQGATPPADPATLMTVAASAAPIAPGGEGVLLVRLTVQPGWHANANPPTLDYLIPTSVEIADAGGLVAAAPRYPAGKTMRFAFAEEPLSVYEHSVVVEVPLRAPPDAAGSRMVRGVVRFQACSDEMCLAPAEVPFQAAVTIGAGGEHTAPDTATAAPRVTPDSAAAMARKDTTSAGDGVVFTGASAAAPNPIRRLFDEHGLLAFFALFALGLGLNLTPCVYPMLSVTLALFGARTERRLWARVPPAFTYMLGIAMTYSVLGLVAAFTGTLFGAVLQSPIVLIAIAALLGLMAFSMFGAFELQLPSGLLTRLSTNTPTGLVGIFFSGVMVGLFAAPCVGPPIVALLAVVAQSGNPWFGFASFFVLSLGLGLPYLILGTFTGLLQNLPRSGDWMVWVKKVFGVLLLSVALFYLALVVKPEWSMWVPPVALIAGGLFLGLLEPWREYEGERKRRAAAGITPTSPHTPVAWLQRALGVAAVVGGAWIIATTPRGGIAFEPYTAARLAQAQAAGRPVILDFYADWCVPCHELDRMTFTHPEVLRHAGSFTALKVDLTRFEAPESKELRERFQIPGVPTVIFLAPDGVEVPNTRVVGFLPGPEFAALARRALEATVQPASARR